MAKRTLLDMTQNILNAMDSDEVNSIGDTVESLQVAEVIAETFEYITVGIDIPGRSGIIQLDASGDPDLPHQMTLPANVEHLDWVRYNDAEVVYMTPLDFVNMTVKRSEDDNATLLDKLYIYTDRDPQFYTSFDDDTLVFDAYNLDEGATLMQARSLCWGQRSLPFLMEDDFVPPLPVEMFPRLLAEAKAACFINYKQVANSKEEQRARQQKVVNMNSRFKAGAIKPIDRLPNYGKRKR